MSRHVRSKWSTRDVVKKQFTKKAVRQMSNMDKRALRQRRQRQPQPQPRPSKVVGVWSNTTVARPTRRVFARCRTYCYGSVRKVAHDGYIDYQTTRYAADQQRTSHKTWIAHNRNSGYRCRYPAGNPPRKKTKKSKKSKKSKKTMIPIRLALRNSHCVVTVDSIDAVCGQVCEQTFCVTRDTTSASEYHSLFLRQVGGDVLEGSEQDMNVVPSLLKSFQRAGDVLELTGCVTMPALPGLYAVCYRLFVDGEKTKQRIWCFATVV